MNGTIRGAQKRVNLSTPVARAPLFVRGGTVVPMLVDPLDATESRSGGGGGGVSGGGGGGLELLVTLSKKEIGTAKGSLFVDDGVSTDTLSGHPGSIRGGGFKVQFSVASRTLTGSGGGVDGTDTAGGVADGPRSVEAPSASQLAFSTVVTKVTVVGVDIGITSIMLTTAAGTTIVPRSQYTWDDIRLVLSIGGIQVDVSKPFTLSWTI
jgi:hypothetical protein